MPVAIVAFLFMLGLTLYTFWSEGRFNGVLLAASAVPLLLAVGARRSAARAPTRRK